MSRLDSVREEVAGMLERRRRPGPGGGGADPAHDMLHVERVCRNARELCRREGEGGGGGAGGINPELVVASALLHDIAPFGKSDPRGGAASEESARVAGEVLRRHGYGGEEIAVVRDAVLNHSFSRNATPRTIEGRILQDADRLDAIGAVGIARAFSVGGSEMRGLYSPRDPFCASRSPDDGRWTVDHFYRKLLRLEGMMNTESGRSMARERTAFLSAFLEQLGREIRGEGEGAPGRGGPTRSRRSAGASSRPPRSARP